MVMTIRKSGTWAKILAVALGLNSISGTSFATEQSVPPAVISAEVAPGVILIDLSGNGPHDRVYYQIEVHPSRGEVRLVKEEHFKFGAKRDVPTAFQKPAGSIDSCNGISKPEAPSWDGRFVARCGIPRGSFSDFNDDFTVIDAKSLSTVYQWAEKRHRRIAGFAWAPNSHSVAVLNQSESEGKSPSELFFGLSGHPVPHNTVYLDLIDPGTGNLTEYLIRKNVLYAQTQISNWSE